MLLAEFTRLPPATRALVLDGLSGAIDLVAEAAPETHRFLRYQWFARGAQRLWRIGAHDPGRARRRSGDRAADGPLRPRARPAGGGAGLLLAVPQLSGERRCGGGRVRRAARPARAGSECAADRARSATAIRRSNRCLRPRASERAGRRSIASSPTAISSTWRRPMPMAAGRATRRCARTASTRSISASTARSTGGSSQGAELAAGGFDALAAIEEKSWIAARTDGRDAKFTTTGHGAFWRAAAGDPVLAKMLWAALLTVDGAPAAFSFDVNAGALKYAIANSYDPAFAKHSPGKLLYYRNLVRAMADGIDTVDWGAGDSGYKRVIGAAKGPAIRDWLLVRPGLPAMAGRALARRVGAERPAPARRPWLTRFRPSRYERRSNRSGYVWNCRPLIA